MVWDSGKGLRLLTEIWVLLLVQKREAEVMRIGDTRWKEGKRQERPRSEP